MRARRWFGVVAALTVAATVAGIAPRPPAADAAGPTPLESGVKPDITLTPHGKRFVKTVVSPMVGGYPLVWTPYECRHNAVSTTNCDVYRIKLNLSHAPGAQNLVVISVDFKTTKLPDLNLVATGLGLTSVPDLDLKVFYNASDHINPANNGGVTLNVPERVAWVAQQKEFDLVVEDSIGVSTGYTISAFMTDEIFAKPYEALDDVKAPVDNSEDNTLPDASLGLVPQDSGLPSLGLAPIDPDSQISSIGSGIDEQFPTPFALGGAARNTAAVSKAPSALALVLALGVFPVLLAVLGAGFLRRRRDAII